MWFWQDDSGAKETLWKKKSCRRLQKHLCDGEISLQMISYVFIHITQRSKLLCSQGCTFKVNLMKMWIITMQFSFRLFFKSDQGDQVGRCWWLDWSGRFPARDKTVGWIQRKHLICNDVLEIVEALMGKWRIWGIFFFWWSIGLYLYCFYDLRTGEKKVS